MKSSLIILVFLCSPCVVLKSQAVLNYFKLQLDEKQVILNWELTIGNTCDGIEIQHSVDSIQFIKIGEISGVCGSKTESIDYQFRHSNPIQNRKNYYRLALGGFGNQYTESIAVYHYKNGVYLTPNPVRDLIQLRIEDPTKLSKISITNMFGQNIFEIQPVNMFQNIVVNQWQSGLYFLNIFNEQKQQVAYSVFQKL